MNKIIPSVIFQSSEKQWMDDSLAFVNPNLKNKRLNKTVLVSYFVSRGKKTKLLFLFKL